MNQLTFSDPPARRDHPETSKDAAASMLDKTAALRRAVYAYIVMSDGATDEETQDRTGINPSTQRPRRVELVRAGLVVDSGERRKTRSGGMAIVWRAK